MSIYFGNSGHGFFRKEDVQKALKSQRLALGIVLVGLLIVNLVMAIYVIPQLSEITTINSTSWLSLILAVMGGYVLFGEKNYEKIDQVVKKYKEGELIPVRELMNWRYDIVGILLIMGTVGYWIYVIILPIYTLTNQF